MRNLGPFCLALALAAGCASAPPRASRRDAFPLDPREELTGPFAEGIDRGAEALLEGEAAEALSAFEGARAGHGTAAQIGWIEAMVLAGRSKEAVSACAEALRAGEPTVPLLVGCGEARARSGDFPAGLALYEQAVTRTRERQGIRARAEELRSLSRDTLLQSARASAEQKKWAAARVQIARAIGLAPQSAELRVAAGDIESAAEEAEAAFRRYHEALELEPKNPSLREKVGDLAMEVRDFAAAVAVFDELARTDARFRPRAEKARLAFRVANWPSPEREAARSPHLTRAGAASLVWWMFPEVRDAGAGAGVIASDVVSRRDSRAITRALSLGLLEVDRETHRANPDAHLALPAASRLFLRLLVLLTPAARERACLGSSSRVPRMGTEAVRVAEECGLLFDAEGPGISGEIFTRALDRVRAMASGKGEISDE